MVTGCVTERPPRPLPLPPERDGRDRPRPPGGRRLGAAAPQELGARPPGGPRAAGGGRTPPAHPCPAAPGLGRRGGGATPPPDRPLRAGGRTGRGGKRGGGDLVAFPHPNTAAARPLLEEAVVSVSPRPAPRSYSRTLLTPLGPGRPQAPALAPGEGTIPSPGPFLSRRSVPAPPTRSPARGRRGFHTFGDSPEATVDTGTLRMGVRPGARPAGALVRLSRAPF